MDLEDFDLPNSWISIKAIREAADIRSSLGSNTLNKSDTVVISEELGPEEIKLTSTTEDNNIIHNQLSQTSFNHTTCSPSSELNFSKLERKYKNNILRLNEEIMILSSQLKLANEFIAKLSKSLTEINNKHVMHLQALHERHESRIKRYRNDLQLIVKESNLKNINFLSEVLVNEHNFEINNLKSMHQEEIIEKERFFLNVIENQRFESSKKTNAVKEIAFKLINDLKYKFLEEIEYLEYYFKEKIKKERMDFRKSMRFSNVINEDDSTVVEVDNESANEEHSSGNCYSSYDYSTRVEFIFNKFKEEFDCNPIFQESEAY